MKTLSLIIGFWFCCNSWAAHKALLKIQASTPVMSSSIVALPMATNYGAAAQKSLDTALKACANLSHVTGVTSAKPAILIGKEPVYPQFKTISEMNVPHSVCELTCKVSYTDANSLVKLIVEAITHKRQHNSLVIQQWLSYDPIAIAFVKELLTNNDTVTVDAIRSFSGEAKENKFLNQELDFVERLKGHYVAPIAPAIEPFTVALVDIFEPSFTFPLMPMHELTNFWDLTLEMIRNVDPAQVVNKDLFVASLSSFFEARMAEYRMVAAAVSEVVCEEYLVAAKAVIKNTKEKVASLHEHLSAMDEQERHHEVIKDLYASVLSVITQAMQSIEKPLPEGS